MRVLKLNSLCGIKNQMYCSEQYVDANRPHNIHNGFFDINSLFWSNILSPEHVREILQIASYRLKDDTSSKVRVVIQSPKVFFETYMTALKALNIPVKEKLLFESLETLEIICHLHSKIYSTPFKLTLASGYVHSSYSALDLANICLSPFCNPYLSFIESEIIPKIIAYKPNILLLTGKPNIASFAIAKIVREKCSNIFIIANEYESDYYSLKKIKDLLVTNTAFFSVYHCVIVNDSENILKKIEQNLSNDNITDLSSVPGIIYSIDEGNTIYQTINNCKQKSSEHIISYFNKNDVLNIRAFPQNHCYWNRCSFCGINSKYDNIQNQEWDIDAFILRLKKLYNCGLKKMWLLDEAIPITILRQLANLLLHNNIHIIWHVRTRIEPQFVDEAFAELLFKAGLRHIIFGFETASDRILKLIKKNNDNFDYLEIAEKIVQTFSSNGITVHFSSILGFPAETKVEREETISFLSYIYDTYNNFSYNVNTFYLDIGSKMYQRWESFGISSLAYPCAPKYFLENYLDWDSAISSDKFITIKKEQENLMARQYPWYPEGTLLQPSVFFSFWEYSRYCLQETSFISSTNNESFQIDMNKIICFSPMVSFIQEDVDLWMLYHLKNHNYVIGGNILYDLVDAASKGFDFNKFIGKYEKQYIRRVETLIFQLTRMEFFI